MRLLMVAAVARGGEAVGMLKPEPSGPWLLAVGDVMRIPGVPLVPQTGGGPPGPFAGALLGFCGSDALCVWPVNRERCSVTTELLTDRGGTPCIEVLRFKPATGRLGEGDRAFPIESAIDAATAAAAAFNCMNSSKLSAPFMLWLLLPALPSTIRRRRLSAA